METQQTPTKGGWETNTGETNMKNEYGTLEELQYVCDLWNLTSEIATENGYSDPNTRALFSPNAFFTEALEEIPAKLKDKIKHNIDLLLYYLDQVQQRREIGSAIRSIIHNAGEIKLKIEDLYPDLFEEEQTNKHSIKRNFDEEWNKKINSNKPNDLFVSFQD